MLITALSVAYIGSVRGCLCRVSPSRFPSAGGTLCGLLGHMCRQGSQQASDLDASSSRGRDEKAPRPHPPAAAPTPSRLPSLHHGNASLTVWVCAQFMAAANFKRCSCRIADPPTPTPPSPLSAPLAAFPSNRHYFMCSFADGIVTHR
jgi:hypothetical protein